MFPHVLTVFLLLCACTPSVDVVFECETFSCVPEVEQAPGDPEIGRDRVLNRGTNSCGVPASIFDLTPALFQGVTVPGRTGDNVGLSYGTTAGVSSRGVDVYGGNCLSCHASVVEGEVVIGRPNPLIRNSALGDDLEVVRSLLDDPEDLAEVDAVAPVFELLDRYVIDTVGTSRGDFAFLTTALHRDPETLAWLDEPLAELPAPPPYPIDPPPWWGMVKKRSMFWNTAARGDYSNFVLNGVVICADDADWAAQIFADAPDVAAWVRSIEAPVWPHGIDEGLADEGERVFLETCARCHGTYGEDGEYPNVVVPVDDVGTDPTLANDTSTWQRVWDAQLSSSIFGEGVDWQPQPGYIAPPLDGIWASAPYLHNGSVPTLALVLDSTSRPERWRHLDLEVGVYDPDDVGWRYEIPELTKAEATEEDAPYIYETTLAGYANTGHTFGDGLTEGERAAVIEYLKTL